MRHSASLLLAALSALAVGRAATRPHYGGTLRVEIADSHPLAALTLDPLIGLDAAGTPQPAVALTWEHDAAFKRWRFTLRPGVKLHDGSPLTPAIVAAAVQDLMPGATAAPAGDAIVVKLDRPASGLPLHLAQNAFLPTGPFRLAAFNAGRSASFIANEDYWDGRPFLDAIEVQMGRPLRDQSTDLELGKTDVAEIGPADVRRAGQRGRTVWSSAAAELIALVLAPGRVPNPAVAEALSLSINRAAMYNVLLQKQGEISAALLPQWMSGYAFAFDAAPDIPRARALLHAKSIASLLTLTFDPALPSARALADRLAVNARDAGITIQVTPQNPNADMRLQSVRLPSLDPPRALAGLAAALNLETPGPSATVAELYESERKLLADFRVIPLFHLPALYAASSRVRVAGPPLTRLGGWRFANVWLAP